MVTMTAPRYRGAFVGRTLSTKATEQMATWPSVATSIRIYTQRIYIQDSQVSSVKAGKTTVLDSVNLARTLAQAYLGTVEQWYTLHNRGGIVDLLAVQPQLVSLLREASSEALRYFPESQLSLEAATDPDTDTDLRLVLAIGTQLDPQEALQRLRMLDQNWWLGALGRAGGKVCITLEFL